MAAVQQYPLTILRRKQVETRVGLRRSAIYAKLKFNPRRPSDFDPSFPRPIALGAKAVGFIEAEIEAWLAAQMKKSRGEGGTRQ
ncbi:MAG: helix-turn-helix transcriptional regulator [Gammaproteobacteria bacterium]